jgi:hypothetical protein
MDDFPRGWQLKRSLIMLFVHAVKRLLIKRDEQIQQSLTPKTRL